MNERGVWKTLKKGMLTKWHATRVESSSGNGVPDISYGMTNMNGWLELKYIETWPKRDTTKIKLKLRPEQKIWISQRGRISGQVWVLCRICDDFFLLNWYQAIDFTEGKTFTEWFTETKATWSNRINYDELAELLKRRQ